MRNRAFLKVVLLGLLTFAFVPGLAGAASQGQDLTGMLASAAAERAVAVSGAVINVSPASHDFGRVNVGGTSGNFDLTINNTGEATLNISSITSSNPDFSASAVSSTVPAHTSTLLHTSYHPTAGSGPESGNISIMSNADNGTFLVLLTGISNNPPTYSPALASDYFANAFVPFSLTATATDLEGDALHWTLSSIPALPVSATFDTNTGALNWTPGSADGGNYAVTIAVSDGVASTPASFTLHVTAGNNPPVANPGGPYEGAVGFPLAFDGSGSTTGDIGQTLTYMWDFGDGSTGTGATPSHTYATAGTRVVTLTVTDNGTPALSSSATTAANILAFVPTRVILEKDYLKRTGNKGHVLVGLELFNHSVADVDAASIKMSSTATGAGTPISALTKGAAIGDMDANTINDFDVFFSGSDVDQLLHGVANGAAVTLNITAKTLAGGLPIAGRISIIATDTGPYPANGPVLTVPASQTVNEGAALSFSVSASDPDGQAIDSWLASPLPAGSSITVAADVQSATFNWTPGAHQAGTYNVSFFASNLFTGSGVVKVTVKDPTAPILAQPANMTVSEGGLALQSITATDADGDALTFTKASGPAYFTVVGQSLQSALIRLAPGFTDAGAATGKVRVSDGFAHTSAESLTMIRSFTITVNNVSQAPVVDPIGNLLIAAGRTMDEAITASDIDDDPITFSRSAGPTWVTVTTGVPDSSTSPITATGNVHAAPPAGTNGDFPVTVRGTDATSLFGEKTFTIHVHAADAAPVVTAPALVGGAPKRVLTVEVSAADPDGDALATLTANLSGLPNPNNAVFTSTDPASGTLTWTPRNQDQSGANPYTVTFTSSNWLSGSASTKITVTPQTDHAPVVSAPATAAATVGSQVTVNATASDPDANPIVSFTAAGAAVDSGGTFSSNATHTSCTFTWTPAAKDSGDQAVTFSASDGVLGGAATTVIHVPNSSGNGAIHASLAAVRPGSVSISPNPLNPKANLRFTMAKAGYARVKMYDLSGRLVRTLMDEPNALAGLHTVVIDGRGNHGEKLASGIYYYRVETAERTVDGKFTILK